MGAEGEGVEKQETDRLTMHNETDRLTKHKEERKEQAKDKEAHKRKGHVLSGEKHKPESAPATSQRVSLHSYIIVSVYLQEPCYINSLHSFPKKLFREVPSAKKERLSSKNSRTYSKKSLRVFGFRVEAKVKEANKHKGAICLNTSYVRVSAPQVGLFQAYSNANSCVFIIQDAPLLRITP